MTTRVIPITAGSSAPRPAAPGRQAGSPGAVPSSLRTAPGTAGPERAAFPFGPNIRAFLKQFMPIAEYGARCVADSDRLAERAKELAHGEAGR